MNTLLLILCLYLFVGLILLVLFDVVTKRIRRKLNVSAQETQTLLVYASNITSYQVARVLFVIAMWLFWPFVFIGAIKGGD